MGPVAIPGDRLYGAQTSRAVANFPVSGQGIGREMIRALGLIKLAAARVNRRLGLLEPGLSRAIGAAARQVAAGALDDHFPVDVFQTGSGTSSNMNANEVIANVANLRLGSAIGARHPVHPNDHVNLGQSSNDVFPSAIQVASACVAQERLIPALELALAELTRAAGRFSRVIKVGRTHLQDATPIRLGQEFSGYASQVSHATAGVRAALEGLLELPLGGTAVGTGINAHPEFGAMAARQLARLTGLPFREAPDHFAAQASLDRIVAMSAALRSVAIAFTKIANDIRWMGSGPRLGLAELRIPDLQPGSSIMPGKVNPVVAEALLMVCAQVVGNDAAIAHAGMSGNFELNVMMPLAARNLIEQVRLLSAATRLFAEKLLRGLEANADRIAERVEQSLAMATALVPLVGYDKAAALARESERTGRTIRELALAEKLLPRSVLARVLDPETLAGPPSPRPWPRHSQRVTPSSPRRGKKGQGGRL